MENKDQDLINHYAKLVNDRYERAARLQDTDPYAAALFQHVGDEAFQAAERLRKGES